MKIRNLSKRYGEQVVFEDFSLEINEGEITCILGASGVGKTTLLRIFAGLTEHSGEIERLPCRAAFVFQEHRLLPHLTVAQNLQFVGGRDEDIQEILEKTELTALKDKRAGTLSGGEKQRVSIARAFLADAQLLLLDEPFSSLDTGLKIRLIRVLARLWEEKKPTTILVTHDLEEALALGHRIVVIEKGKVSLDVRPNRSDFPSVYGESETVKKEILRVLCRENG